LKPTRLAGDKAYDDSSLRAELAEEGIKVYVPSRIEKDRLNRQGFEYDEKSGTVICRAGKMAIGSSPHNRGGSVFYFSEKDCKACPRRTECLGRNQTRKRVYVNAEVHRNRVRGIKRAMRIRRTIERVFGEAKLWHNMARARYRRRSRVAIQVLLTFICLNAKKMSLRLQSGANMT